MSASAAGLKNAGLKSLDSLPGPGKFFLYQARNDFAKNIMRLGEEHPRMFKMWLGQPFVVATHPAVARQVLTRPQDFPKKWMAPESRFVTQIKDTFRPGGLVFDNGTDWSELRKPLDPAFDRAILPTFVPKFAEVADRLLAKWSPGGVFDAKKDMNDFALDVLGETVLGQSFGALEGKFTDDYTQYLTVMEEMMNPLYLALPILEAFPTARNRRYRDALLAVKALCQRSVDQRLEQRRLAEAAGQPDDFPQDLLDMVLGPGVDAKGVVPEHRVLEVLWIFFLAGHDTTQMSLMWLMGALARHPEIQQKAREEAIAVLNGASNPTADMLDNVPYISAVINEGLRLRPPVYNLHTRATDFDTELDGVLIPKGTGVSLHIAAINRHPDAWDEPNVFKPERFLIKDKNAKGPRVFNFLPFSAGPRRCIGDRFSLMEQKTLLVKLLAGFELLPVSDFDHFDNASVPTAFLQAKELKVEVRPLQ